MAPVPYISGITGTTTKHAEGADMANVICLKYENPGGQVSLGPDETRYFWLGPSDDFGSGAITVTAIPGYGDGSKGAMFMEVVQMATRQQNAPSGVEYYLDIVVRNNTHVDDEQTSTIESFWVYVSVITP
jgi:hypothetical protein